MMVARRNFCMSSKTGSVIAGVVYLVLSIIVTGVMLQNATQNMSWRRVADMSMFFELGFTIFTLLKVSFSAAMVFGVIRERPGFMFPWLAMIFTIILVSVSAGLAVTISLIASLFTPVLYGPNFVTYVGVPTIITAVEILVFSVVYYHYKLLISAAAEQTPSYSLAPSAKSPPAYQKV